MESIEVHHEPDRLAREWEQLADRVGAPPFLRPYWTLPWWQAFGRGQLAVFALRRDARLAAVVPVCLENDGMRSTTNEHTPQFGVVAEDHDAAGALVEALFATSPRKVTVAFIDGQSELPHWRKAAEAARYRWAVRTLLRSPYLDLATFSWGEYESTLPSDLRSEVRRRQRRLGERGEVTFEVTSGDEDLDRLLNEGFAVEGSGWKSEQRTAIESSPRTAGFYRTLAHSAAERGSLRLAFLRVDGRSAAFALGLEESGVYYMLKSGYDPALRDVAPGIVLRYELVSRAFAVRLTRYEFLGADEPWKLVFASTTRERVQLLAFPRSAGGLVRWATASHARPLAKRLGLGRLRRMLRGRGVR